MKLINQGALVIGTILGVLVSVWLLREMDHEKLLQTRSVEQEPENGNPLNTGFVLRQPVEWIELSEK